MKLGFKWAIFSVTVASKTQHSQRIRPREIVLDQPRTMASGKLRGLGMGQNPMFFPFIHHQQ
jgi:hypothetical protein